MEANRRAPGDTRETMNYAVASLWGGVMKAWGRIRRLDWCLKNPANILQLQGLVDVLLVCQFAPSSSPPT